MTTRHRRESKSKKSYILRSDGVAYAHGECLEGLEACAETMFTQDQVWTIVPKGRRKSTYFPLERPEPEPVAEEEWEDDFPELLFG